MTEELNGLLSRGTYTPGQAADVTLRHIQWMRETKSVAMSLPIPSIGEYFKPVRPGQIVGILAQTSNYKTSFLRIIETATAKALYENRSSRVLVHVSTEEDIEEMGINSLSVHDGMSPEKLAVGRFDDWNKLVKMAMNSLSRWPILRIGMSLTRENGWEYEDLYLSNIFRAMEHSINQMDLLLHGVGIDYLQALPFDPDREGRNNRDKRRLQVRDDVYRIRSASKKFATPFWVAIQAKQKLESPLSSSVQIPGVYDGMETSDIAQRFDRLISLWLPKQTYPTGKKVRFGSARFEVKENLLFARVLKQRGRLPSGRVWSCSVDYNKEIIRPDDSMFNFEGDDDE